MSVTVVPAYRVIKRFVKDVASGAPDAALDALESKIKTYLQHSLASTSTPLPEIGQRMALTQLGDPHLPDLTRALEEIEAGDPKGQAEIALQRCAQTLPRPDLTARVLLLPGDGQSRVLTTHMHGVVGLSLGAQVMLLFIWPTGDWLKWLTYTVTHEYAHLVRNLFFPRAFVGNRLVYQKSQEAETLLDAMVAEGIADAFAKDLHTDLDPQWTNALSPEAEALVWPKVRRRLAVYDTSEIRRLLSGDNDRIPQWSGYTIGYKLVKGYLDRHSVKPSSLVSMTAKAILEGSGYQVEAVSS